MSAKSICTVCKHTVKLIEVMKDHEKLFICPKCGRVLLRVPFYQGAV